MFNLSKKALAKREKKQRIIDRLNSMPPADNKQEDNLYTFNTIKKNHSDPKKLNESEKQLLIKLLSIIDEKTPEESIAILQKELTFPVIEAYVREVLFCKMYEKVETSYLEDLFLVFINSQKKGTVSQQCHYYLASLGWKRALQTSFAKESRIECPFFYFTSCANAAKTGMHVSHLTQGIKQVREFLFPLILDALEEISQSEENHEEFIKSMFFLLKSEDEECLYFVINHLYHSQKQRYQDYLYHLLNYVRSINEDKPEDQKAMVKLLLSMLKKCGVDIKPTPQKYNNALMLACQYGDSDMALRLIGRADVNYAREGITPLMLAALNKHTNLAEQLAPFCNTENIKNTISLKKGIPASIKKILITELKKQEIITLLNEYKIQLDKSSTVPLHEIAQALQQVNATYENGMFTIKSRKFFSEVRKTNPNQDTVINLSAGDLKNILECYNNKDSILHLIYNIKFPKQEKTNDTPILRSEEEKNNSITETVPEEKISCKVKKRSTAYLDLESKEEDPLKEFKEKSRATKKQQKIDKKQKKEERMRHRNAASAAHNTKQEPPKTLPSNNTPPKEKNIEDYINDLLQDKNEEMQQNKKQQSDEKIELWNKDIKGTQPTITLFPHSMFYYCFYRRSDQTITPIQSTDPNHPEEHFNQLNKIPFKF